jgi:NADH-quinone oxidoreductase subunit K
MAPSFSTVLILACVLFALGFMGLMIRRNVLVMLMCIEVMLNAANLVFIATARYTGQTDGHVMAFFVMTVAAAEAAIGLAILLTLFRQRETLSIEDFTLLKG